MAWYDVLMQQGYVPAGVQPKVVNEMGVSSFQGDDPLSSMARSLEVFQAKEDIKQEENLKKQKSKMDMYKTLRDAGYEPKSAYDAVMEGTFPEEAGGETSKEKVAGAQVEKVKAQTERLKTYPAPSVRMKIIEKVAVGEELTPGEQKVYDDVIRKRDVGGRSESGGVSGILNKKTAAGKAGTEDYVPMTDLSGKKKLVPRGNVEKAKAKGWTLR